MQRQDSSRDSKQLSFFFFSGPAVRLEGRKQRCSWSSTHLVNGSCCLLGQTVYFHAKGCVFYLFLKFSMLWKNIYTCIVFFPPIPFNVHTTKYKLGFLLACRLLQVEYSELFVFDAQLTWHAKDTCVFCVKWLKDWRDTAGALGRHLSCAWFGTECSVS